MIHRCAGLNVILSLIALVGASSCALAPPDAPADLGPVLGDVARFAATPEAPASESETGAPVTELEALAGCWGTAWQAPAAIPGQFLVVRQALRLDASGGQLERSIYQAMPLAPPVVFVQRGRLTLTAAGEADFDVQQVLSTVRTGRLTDETDIYDPRPRYRVRLFTEGTRLNVAFDEADTPRTSGGFADGFRLWHTSFDCP